MTTEQVDTDGQPPLMATRVQVAAARLKLVTSRKLGETAPPWVERLARDGSPNSRSARGQAARRD